MTLIRRTLINRIMSKKSIKFAMILSLALFCNIQKSISQPNYNSYSSDTPEMRYGLMINQMFAGSYGGFFEYQFNEYFGLRTGLEYGYNVCFLFPKGFASTKDKNETFDLFLSKLNSPFNLDNDLGIYVTKFISIPLYARLYPGGGDFSIYLGLKQIF